MADDVVQAGPEADSDSEYAAYLERFSATLGECEVGAFRKHQEKLIQKMQAAEFAKVWEEYREAESAYQRCVERGDTINDIVVRILRDCSAKLVLSSPV